MLHTLPRREPGHPASLRLPAVPGPGRPPAECSSAIDPRPSQPKLFTSISTSRFCIHSFNKYFFIKLYCMQVLTPASIGPRGDPPQGDLGDASLGVGAPAHRPVWLESWRRGPWGSRGQRGGSHCTPLACTSALGSQSRAPGRTSGCCWLPRGTEGPWWPAARGADADTSGARPRGQRAAPASGDPALPVAHSGPRSPRPPPGARLSR